MKKSLACLALIGSLALPPVHAWAADAAAPQADAENPDLRLALEKVNLYAETNKLDQAFALLDHLKNQYPDNPQVLQTEADLSLRIGNRGAGFAALNKAIELDPNNEDILERQRTALMDQGPFTSAGYNFIRMKEAFQSVWTAAGQAAVSSSVSAGLNLQDDHLHSRTPVAMVNGSMRNFDDDRQRGTLTLDKTYDSGNEAGVMAYANNNTPGIGGQYSWWDHKGATTVQANIRKPDWDYVETVVQDGTRDNIRLERKQIVTSHLQATLGGGFNNYNLQDDADVARAAAWDLNVAYTHPYTLSPGDDVLLGAYYTVDAEYFTHRDEGTTTTGATFRPLPVTSYEIHSVNFSASKDLSSLFHLEGYGGYGVNRLGGNGPLFGGALVYAPMEHLGIELRGARTMLGGEQNNAREDQLGLNVKWRW